MAKITKIKFYRVAPPKVFLKQQLNVKKCPSSIRCWDLNSRPLEHESPLITTRPGLLHKFPFEVST